MIWIIMKGGITKTEEEVRQRIDKLRKFQDRLNKISVVSKTDTEEFIMNIEQQIQELKWVLGEKGR